MDGLDRTPLTTIRFGAWAWLVTAAGVATAGTVSLYRNPSQLRIEEFSALYESIGLSDRFMATTVLILPFYVAWAAAAYIIWRRAADRGAVVISTGIVALYFYISGLGHNVGNAWVRNGLVSMSAILIVVLLVTVPTGGFLPRWSGIAPAAAVLLVLLRPQLAVDVRWVIAGTADGADTDLGLTGALWLGVIAVALSAQAIRYRGISSELERNQSRWLILGTVPLLLPPVVVLLLAGVQEPRSGLVTGLLLLTSLGSYLLPAALLVAVFRYHLFEIDRIISRTATYAAVVLVVGLVYAIPVLVLPTILGASNELIVAGSTLAAAAVFNPVRRRIQRRAERRFNRSNYDAEHEVDAISARLHSETSLDSVTENLTAVVTRTVQPGLVVLWIRDPR
jgi:hypothetical protein